MVRGSLSRYIWEPHSRFYSLSGHVLGEVTEAKYLGVTIANDLSWSTHISVITQKENVIMAFLHWSLNGCPSKTKEVAYNALVRSVLEYCAPIWDPFLIQEPDQYTSSNLIISHQTL